MCFYEFDFAGDVGFDEREILRDAGHLDDGLYKSNDAEPKETEIEAIEEEKDKSMDIDLPPPVGGDGFEDGFMGK